MNEVVHQAEVQGLQQRVMLAERALHDSEQRYRRIVETTSQGIWMVDRERNTPFMNEPMAQMLGYTAEEALELNASDVLDSQVWGHSPQPLEGALQGQPLSFDVRFIRKDGKRVWAQLHSTLMKSSTGAVEGAFGLVSPHGPCGELERRLAAIVTSSNDAIVSKGLDGCITSWNQAATELFGYTASEAIGQPITLIIPPQLQGSPSVKRIEAGEAVRRYETLRTCKDGHQVEVLISASAIRDEDGQVIGVARVIHDLTLQRRTEAAAQQTQKMEALGRMAAGVAHDFNNLLAVVNTMAQAALNDLGPRHPLREDL